MQLKHSSLITLPVRFYTDHEERELPTPRVLHRTKKYVWVSSVDPACPELLADAEHYAHPDGPCQDREYMGLKVSARVTASRLRSAGVLRVT